jgi:hypothetical protein
MQFRSRPLPPSPRFIECVAHGLDFNPSAIIASIQSKQHLNHVVPSIGAIPALEWAVPNGFPADRINDAWETLQ